LRAPLVLLLAQTHALHNGRVSLVVAVLTPQQAIPLLSWRSEQSPSVRLDCKTQPIADTEFSLAVRCRVDNVFAKC